MAGASRANHLLVMLLLMSGSYTGVMAGSGSYVGAMARSGSGGVYIGLGFYGGPNTVGEAARRVLVDNSSDHISYRAMASGDTVPCSIAGRSYYDCEASAAANPYNPACTVATLCARNTT